MQDERRSPPQSDRGELHIVADLIAIVVGQWRPAASRSTYLVRHLPACDECWHVLDDVIETLASDRVPRDGHWPGARQLLQHLREAAVERRIRSQIPPYIDTLLLEGAEAAASDHQELAEHLGTCRACREDVWRLRRIVQQLRARETLRSQVDTAVQASAQSKHRQSLDRGRPEDATDLWAAAIAPGASASARQYLIADLRANPNSANWSKAYHYCAHLIRLHRPPNSGIADADAHDLTQDVMLRFQRSLDTLSAQEHVNIRTWLIVVAKHTANAYFRRAAREAVREDRISPHVPWAFTDASGEADSDSLFMPASHDTGEPTVPDGVPGGPIPEEAAVFRELLERVGESIRRFVQQSRDPERTKRILDAWMSGVPAREIAQSLGITASTVDNVTFRLRGFLRHEMPELSEGVAKLGSDRRLRTRDSQSTATRQSHQAGDDE